MNKGIHRFGWLKDQPDSRDFSMESSPVLKDIGSQLEAPKTKTVDLRQFCPPIEDQGNIGSCTAQAGAGIIEFYEKKARETILTPPGYSSTKSLGI